VGERQEPELHVDLDPVERLGDPAKPARARGRERHDLMSAVGGLGQPTERAADVVADARALVRERAHVEGDPHGR